MNSKEMYGNVRLLCKKICSFVFGECHFERLWHKCQDYTNKKLITGLFSL